MTLVSGESRSPEQAAWIKEQRLRALPTQLLPARFERVELLHGVHALLQMPPAAAATALHV